MKFKIILIFLVIASLILCSCGEKTNVTQVTCTTVPNEVTTIEPTVQMNSDIYTLCGSFGFYKGNKEMSDIQTITFSRIKPDIYDECWSANLSNTEHITGYLINNDVVIVGNYIYANKRCSYMFAAYNQYGDPLWSSLTSINGLELLDTSYVTNMKMMFAHSKLTNLDGIGKWDVSNVKTFAGMFQGNDNAGDIKLKYLDIGQWDVSSAENMSHMFYGCALIEYIPVDNWDVSSVTTFSHMFADCHSLKSINFSKWDTTSATSFDGFLNDCHSLVVIDVSGLETSNCVQFSQMFEACINLEHVIGLETWNVSSASNYAFSETFHCCYKLKELNIGDWIVAPDNTARMFKNCYSLVQLDLSGFDMSNIQHMDEMFMNCDNLIEIIGFEEVL